MNVFFKIDELKNIFMANKKFFIPVSGLLLFILAGLIVGLIIPVNDESGNFSQPAGENLNNEISKQPDEIKPDQDNKKIYVYVTGAVKKSGVYILSEDSRIFQAIEAAGGFTPQADSTHINLSARLKDESHVHVQTIYENDNQLQNQISTQINAPGTPIKTRVNDYDIVYEKNNGVRNNSDLVDINYASENELIKLRGVGTVTARRIIEYRNAHGRFHTVEDLLNIRGIGEAKLNKMRDQILIR